MQISFSIRFYLSERFRLRFEDVGFDEIVDETTNGSIESTDNVAIHNKNDANGEANWGEIDGFDATNHAVHDTTDGSATNTMNQMTTGAIRTLDGEIAGDEFASDAINYQLLLEKIDALLERLKLDA